MNFANTSDVDAALHATSELRTLLTSAGQLVNGMLAMLVRREQSLLDCRQELVAHLAELAEREATAPMASGAVASPPEATPPERMLTFASGTAGD
jgi:hypothetical protein